MKRLTGINIQFPISRLILSGEKTIETRTYPIPPSYIGKELAIIETPGNDGDFEARIVGTIVFSGCFLYRDKISFYADENRHHVSADSPWKWNEKKPKWGWQIESVNQLKKAVPAPKTKGIVYTKAIVVP